MRTFSLQPSAQAKPYTTRICKKKTPKNTKKTTTTKTKKQNKNKKTHPIKLNRRNQIKWSKNHRCFNSFPNESTIFCQSFRSLSRVAKATDIATVRPTFLLVKNMINSLIQSSFPQQSKNSVFQISLQFHASRYTHRYDITIHVPFVKSI